jgi:hypothetical protein
MDIKSIIICSDNSSKILQQKIKATLRSQTCHAPRSWTLIVVLKVILIIMYCPNMYVEI